MVERTEKDLINDLSDLGLAKSKCLRLIRRFIATVDDASGDGGVIYNTFPFKYGSPPKGGYFALRRTLSGEILAQVSYGGGSYEYSLAMRRTIREEEPRVLNYLTNKLLPSIGLGEWNVLKGKNIPGTGYTDDNNLVLGLKDPTLLSSVPQGYAHVHGFGYGASFKIKIENIIKHGRVSFI